ncbi:DMT family transporter [Paenibacillus turpanensis]|uniref:DMT family transporter n=1 Tax=Paenibacillus turpanensis TaxID=2689078 RepID=UPI00140E504B|nr:DMT family transporter [Paenibacillus turpanensis]
MKANRFPLSTYALLGVGIIAISFSAIFVKFSEAPVSVIAMQRLLITIVLMLPFVWRAREEIRRISRRDWVGLLLSGSALGLHFLLWMGSLRFTTVASSTVLMTLEPVLVMAGAYFLYRERTTPSAIAGAALAIAGAILIGIGDFAVSGSALLGDLLSVLGTVAVVGHMLIGQDLRSRMGAMVYSFFVFLTAGLFFLVYNIVIGHELIAYPAKEWGLFLLMAIVPTVFGHLLFNWLMRDVGATVISMAVIGEPVGATLLAWLMLGEAVSPLTGAACVLLMLGVVLFLARHRSAPHGDAPQRPHEQPSAS